MSTQEPPENDGKTVMPDLSVLADFQFGPAWARKDTERASSFRDGASARSRRSGEKRFERHRSGEGEQAGGHFRDRNERVARRDNGKKTDDHRRDGKRPFTRDRKRERVEPTPGVHVELRPADSTLLVFEQEIKKHKRALSALDLARVIMADRQRYDLVFISREEEDGPALISSQKGDGACWIDRSEALAYVRKASWFSEYYAKEELETEAPKGTFTAIARCGLSGRLIGPVNWHGYQTAVLSLHRSLFPKMNFERYKSNITLEKSEEVIAEWMKQATHKTVWKPLREGAENIVLESEDAVEADFAEHHFGEVYTTGNKVFVNGAVSWKLLSPGLRAHASVLTDHVKRVPKTLIPNLCHGLARHRLPIFKWQGRHYTGPSRTKAIPQDTVLADRMRSIVEWVKEHQGKPADKLFAELSGVSGEDKEKAQEAYAPFVADLFWLMEQGFLLVLRNNTVWYPKASVTPTVTENTSSQETEKGEEKTGSSSSQESADGGILSSEGNAGKVKTQVDETEDSAESPKQ